jgi:hypothetical protein
MGEISGFKVGARITGCHWLSRISARRNLLVPN